MPNIDNKYEDFNVPFVRISKCNQELYHGTCKSNEEIDEFLSRCDTLSQKSTPISSQPDVTHRKAPPPKTAISSASALSSRLSLSDTLFGIITARKKQSNVSAAVKK